MRGREKRENKKGRMEEGKHDKKKKKEREYSAKL